MVLKHVIALHAPELVGFRHGLRQPAQTITLRLGPLPTQVDWPRFDAWLAKEFGVELDEPPTWQAQTAVAATFWRILLLARALLRFGNVPVFEPGRLLGVHPDPDTAGGWVAEAAIAQVDYIPEQWPLQIYEAAAIIVSGWQAQPEDFTHPGPLQAQLESHVLGPIRKQQASTYSALALLQVADEHRIPWRHMGNGVYQLGLGANQRRIQNGQVDSDSLLGKHVERHKFLTAQWLRRAGLPAPEHVLVADAEAAVAAANAMGGELVIKPADSVMGQGVSLHVRSEAEVRAAFAKAAAVSPQVLVERMVTGKVHHIQVAGGEILYALHRHPAAVKGDGVHTVAELVAAENSLCNTTLLWRRPTPLPWDAEAFACLKQAGYEPDSVPPIEATAPLREVPTIEAGKYDENVSHLVHPDNAAIALRAARLFGLGLVGIDLISPDISVPWYANGALINEVNHAPTFETCPFAHAALPALMARLIQGDGRIPIEVVVGDDANLSQARARQRHWTAQGLNCFLTSDDLTEDGQGQAQPMALNGAFRRVRALLMDNRVQALVIVLQTDAWLATGLPIDRIDHIERGTAPLLDHINDTPVTPEREAELLVLLEQHSPTARDGA